MAIRSNGNTFHSTGVQHFGAAAVLSAHPSALQQNFAQTNRIRNLTAGEGITDESVGLPLGNLHPNAWMMPQKTGMMSSRAASMSLSATGTGLRGYPIGGTSSLTFIVADATGGLITSGSGSASLTLNTNSPLLTASLLADGSATFAFTPSAAPSAIGSADASASFSITTTAVRLPADDSSPLRTASTSFVIGAALTPYAIGIMEGSTLELGMTPAGIAAAVLAAAEIDPIAANIKQVNDVQITGAGVAVTDEWRPL